MTITLITGANKGIGYETAKQLVGLQYAKAHPDIRFNALEPGTTATDLTASMGIGRPVAESARVVAGLVTLGEGGPTGTFRGESGELPW